MESPFLLDYYRKIAGVRPDWTITLTKEECGENPVRLRWDTEQRLAFICFHPDWYFSEQAYTQALLHELFELATIETWAVFLKVAQQLPVDVRSQYVTQFRAARDSEIDRRCASLPWFSLHDRPRRIS